MSGECAHLPPHDHVIDRLRRRYGGLKQHSQACQARLDSSHAVRATAERTNTAALLSRAQETKLKKAGKVKMDQLRTKSSDQTCDMRNDSFKQLKRKLDSANGICHNGEIAKPGNLYNGSVVPPSGGMQSYITSTNFGYDSNAEKAKKAKRDAEQSFYIGNATNLSTPEKSSSGSTGNLSSSLSVQIVQNISNETQPSIETTIKMNTNTEDDRISAKPGSQSVNINLSKNVKQETMNQNSNQATKNNLPSTNQKNAENEQQNDAMSENFELFDDLIDNWEWSNETSTPNQTQSNQNEQTPLGTVTSVVDEISKQDSFQCKIEKRENLTFSSNNEISASHYISNANNNNHQPQQQHQVFDHRAAQNVSYNGEKQLSPFNHANCGPQHMNPSVTMTSQPSTANTNSNITSPFLHRLNVSVDSTINYMNENLQQRPQPQQQPSPQQMNMGLPNLNRTTPNTVDNFRRTPEAPPRLSHPPTEQGYTKGLSPSPVAYSITHQPHVSQNFSMSRSQPRMQTNMGTMFRGSQKQDGGAGRLTSPLAQRPRMPVATSPNFPPSYPGGSQRNLTVGRIMQQDTATTNMLAMSSSHGISGARACAQQLKEMAEKRGSIGASNHWNAGGSTSVNIAANMSYNGPRIPPQQQQQRLSSEMQNYTSFQSCQTNMCEQTQGGIPVNISGASAAAQTAMAESKRQNQHVYVSRLSHLPTESTISASLAQNAMLPETAYANRGAPNPSQLQDLKSRIIGAPAHQIMRRQSGPSPDMVPGHNQVMSGVLGRQMDPYSHGGMTNSHMFNGSAAAMHMRVNQATSLSVSQRMGEVHQQKLPITEQFKMKSAMYQPATLTQRGPSPLAGPTHLALNQQQIPPQGPSPPMMGSGVNSANMFHGHQRSTPLGGIEGLRRTQNVAIQAWNRNSYPSTNVNNGVKIQTYNMNHAAHPVQPNLNGYQTMGGVLQRGNPMAIQGARTVYGGGASQVPSNTTVLSHRQMSGNVQSSQVQAHNTGSYPPRMFSLSGMMGNNPVGQSHSQVNQSFSSQSDMLSGFEMFNQPNSPNVELNLISDLLDGK